MIPEYFAYLTIILGLIGVFFYIKDTFLGNTKPNRVSWIFWTIAPFVGVYVAYKSGVALPLLISTFMAGFGPLLVVIASFFNKNSYWRTTVFDIVCGLLSFFAIIIWITTKNGIIALSFAILADLFAGLPTIIKSWIHSETESIGPYFYGVINQIITFLIIKNFTFLNFSFPLYLVIANVLIIIGIKRKSFFKKQLS
ncbi:MAG: hypothetical protein KGI58_02410 [Patescibacteria group bacterium]|nr:hypothetical protein [Patescibacteria group bacterium]